MEEDDDERTRVAEPPPQAGGHAQQAALPSHALRSGEIKPRNPAQSSFPAAGDWEEKTVVDDSQLNDPKDVLNGLSYGNGGDEEFTIDEPQRPVAFPMGPPTATPKQTVHGQAPPPSQNASNKLVVIAGNDRGREFPLTGKSITVGRGIDNDIVLTDIAVSRKHLSIEHDGTHYKIVDAGSGNGTLINDELQTGNRALRHGDRIEIGNTVFRFDHPTPAAGKRPDAAGRAAPGPAAGMHAPTPAAPAPSPGPDAQNRPHLPPPQRDEAGPLGAQMPAPAAPGAALPSPAGAPPLGPLDTLPPNQQVAGSAAPALAAPARPAAMPRAPLPATPGRPRTTALAGVPATPRNTLIGTVSALVGIAALAIAGVFMGDDEYLAAENAAAASFEMPTLSMLQQMVASSALLGGGMPEEVMVFEEAAVQTTTVPAPEGSSAPEGSVAPEDGTGEEEAIAPPADGDGDAGSE